MELVRTKSGAADAEDFSASKGSPIVIDEVTGKGYVIKVDGNVVELGAGSYQPLDADLTAIAALGFVSTSFLKKTAADTWALDTNTYRTEAQVTAAIEAYSVGGTYTPTLTNTTNIAASTAYVTQYASVDGTVTVGGKVDVDVTAAGADTVLGMTIPVASDFAEEYQLGGVAVQRIGGAAPGIATIKADTTNNRATFEWYSVGIANYSFFFTFTYRII